MKKEHISLLEKCDYCDNRGIGVRLISDGSDSGESDAYCWKCLAPRPGEVDGISPRLLHLFCDGGVVLKNPSTIGGTWAWCAVNDADERVIERAGFVPVTAHVPLVTNNHTEQIAICLALEAMPAGWTGTVYSDSLIALGRVFENYACRNLPRVIQMRTMAARQRLGAIRWVHLSGHPTKQELLQGYSDRHEARLPVSIHNKWCDEAARRAGARKMATIAVNASKSKGALHAEL